MAQITLDNYCEYLLLEVDGELCAAQVAELDLFFSEHPELEGERHQFDAAKLRPEDGAVFADKQSLLHDEPRIRTIFLATYWRRRAVAAGLAAIFCCSLWVLRDGFFLGGGKQLGLSRSDAKASKFPRGDGRAVAGRQDSLAQHVEEVTRTAPGQSAAGLRFGEVRPGNSHSSRRELFSGGSGTLPGQVQVTQQGSVSGSLPGDGAGKMHGSFSMERVHLVGLTPLQVDSPEVIVGQPCTVMPVEWAALAPSEMGSWLDKLPMELEKKERVKWIASGISDGIEKVGAMKEQIRGKVFRFKVKSRGLVVSN